MRPEGGVPAAPERRGSRATWAALLLAAGCHTTSGSEGAPPGPPALAGPTDAPEGTSTVERRLIAMGTWLEVSVTAADRTRALQASEAAVRALEAVERRLSTWIPDSELSRLNRAPSEEGLGLSPELARDLERALALWRETDGCFDPGVGALVLAWGLRTGGRRPAPRELEAARAAGGAAALELNGRHARRRHPGLVLEEGGFGKGVGLDAALEALSAAGAREALLDLGGQVAILPGPGKTARRVGIAHPGDREVSVLALRVAHGSVATSASSERGITVDGERLSHVLDPRTGHPAPAFGSLTVWAPDATTADALSTGLYVMGPDAALRWAATRAGVEVVVLENEREPGVLRARATRGLAGRLEPLVSGLELRFQPDAGEGPAHPDPHRKP